MPHVVIEVEDRKNGRELFDFYNDFMSKERSKPQAFNSLDELKKSATYQNLPEEEIEQLEQHDEKNLKTVMILNFDDADQGSRFIGQAESKNLLTEEQAEAARSQLNDQNISSHRPGM